MYRVSNRQYLLIGILESRLKAGVKEVNIGDLANTLGVKSQDIMRDVAELEIRGLVRTRRGVRYLVKLTELGLKYLRHGLPEYLLYERIREYSAKGASRLSISELMASSGLEKDEFSAALGILRDYGLVRISRVSVEVVLDEDRVSELLKHVARVSELLGKIGQQYIVESLSDELVGIRRRGIITVDELRDLYVSLTDEALNALSGGAIVPREVVTTLTQELITSGRWVDVEFKEFDLSIEVPTAYPSRKHPYLEFLSYVREVVTSMGFEEMKGPHVELELWNFDILYVPQHHPARSVTDVYLVDGEALSLADPKVDDTLLSVVEAVHRTGEPAGSLGWGYRWDPRRALRLVLRTHTTAVSMRTIFERGCGEYRCFSLDRVFRPDTPDPTHLMEFHQLEGIIVGKRVSFKHLLGFFKEFAKRLGLGETLFRPAYFPFTEPSVEGYIRHPKLGWIEVFPGGMFRPEVLKPLNLVDYRVAAWGIGIDRIAMMVLGIDDIRHLYTNSLELIRDVRVPRSMFR